MRKIAIIGYGGRGRLYAQFCKNPLVTREFELVAVIDNNPDKIKVAKAEMKLNDSQLFATLDEFLSAPKVADLLFICTQDAEHYEHTIKALDAGYNIMLEKPIACSLEHCIAIRDKSKEKNLSVDVCHVLRYSGYFQKIKEIMESGVLGQIIAIEQVENVAYWHQAHSFIRGDWRNEQESNPMILAKCCHDLDMAVYLAGSTCDKVMSTGKLNHFNKEHAPAGATEYCMGGCKCKEACPYDAEKLYLDNLKGMPAAAYRTMWPHSRLMSDGKVTKDKIAKSLVETRYGKCVYLSDNNVVDYQTVNMEFANGITSTLTMTAFSGKSSSRETRIRGSLGDLKCNTDSTKFILEVYGKKPKKVTISKSCGGSHGGGDARMMKALGDGDIATDVSMSIESHIIGFCAEKSRHNEGTPVFLKDYRD